MVRGFSSLSETESYHSLSKFKVDRCSKWSTQRVSIGSLLFVININDLPDKIYNIAKLFADDSKIISVINGQMEKKK